MDSISTAIPEAFSSEAYDSLEDAQKRFDKDLLEFFPEVVPPPNVEPTSQLDSEGRVVFGWDVSGNGQYDVDPKNQLELESVVRWAIEALRNDRERCEKVRILSLVDYGWFQEQELQGMDEIVKHSKNLEIFSITQGDTTHNSSYSAYIEPLWESLKQSPLLSTLIAKNGPILPYRYDTFTSALSRLELANAGIDVTDGTLPKGLKHLSLDYIAGFDTAWFHSHLFESLETLVLRDLKSSSLEVIGAAIQTYIDSNPQPIAPLSQVSLDLFFDWYGTIQPESERLPTTTDILDLLAVGSTFSNLKNLEILSTPSPVPSAYVNETTDVDVFVLRTQTIENALDHVTLISSSFQDLEGLVVLFGPGEVLVTVTDYELVVERLINLFKPLTKLKTLGINLVSAPSNVTAQESHAYFSAIPSLTHLSFRAKYDSVRHWKGYERVADNVSENGWKVEEVAILDLVGEVPAKLTPRSDDSMEEVTEATTVGRSSDEL